MSLYNNGLFITLILSAISLKNVWTIENGDADLIGEWGQWGSWSTCSRPCNIGIKTRSRECKLPNRIKGKMKTNCVGDYKLYQTCNKKPCREGTKDIREEQCEKFNSKMIGGKRYRWEPYHNGEKCKLACRAKGQRFFAKMSDVVIDGTPCSQGDPYHICVSGNCEKIGCDGVLGSDLKFDKCGVCGGDNTTCHIISGIFTRTRLRYGYNHITRFPMGACNINVTQVSQSDNYLALRVTHGKFIVNGNWALGLSKDYNAVGTTINYHRPGPNDLEDPVEFLYVKGPTNSSVDLLLIKQTNNRGILYSYTIPVDNSVQHNPNHPHKHRHNHHPNNDKKHNSKNSLTYKTPPKYIEPEYKEEQKNQVAALTHKNKKQNRYQNDDPGRSNRYKSYLDQIRKQRENARRRNEQSKTKQNSYNNFVAVRNDENYKKQQLHVSGSQTQHGYTGNVKQDSSGVPLALNNQVGVPLKSHNSGSGGVPLASQRYYSNSYSNSRTYYNPSQGVVPLKGNNNHQIAQRYTANRNNGQFSRSFTSHPAPIPAPDTDLSRTNLGYTGRRYYAGTGNINQARPGSNYGIKQPSNSHPQPGINYGVKPGQPLQPNPISDHRNGGFQGQVYHPASHINYVTNRRPGSSYINHNQQPVYIPPNYSGNQGVQGFGDPKSYSSQHKDASIDDQVYIPRRNSNVQLGTLDTKAVYSWKISGFTECSRSCGGGSQDTLIVCVKVDSQTVVTDENCDKVKPAIERVTCNNNVPCSPAWETGEWTECSTTCGRGTKTRRVECRQRVSSLIQISVSASRCQGERRPESRQICNADKPCVRWRIGDWGQCSAECGRGQRTREVVCLDANDNAVPENKCDSPKPRSVEICDMGSCAKTWFFTEWSNECSSECGEGYRTRALYCSANSERCESIRKPVDRKTCKSDIPCGGKWFTGPWTKCSATCGEGVINRDVVCMKKSGRALAVVGEENCLAEDKPAANKPCERNPCQAAWYMTKWTECSRSCDTGTQTREVKCLDATQEHSTECDFDNKPAMRRSCNTESCNARTKNKKTDSKGQCKDIYKNCILVVQARLCNYRNYKKLCCNSCKSHDHNHHHEHQNT